jgi:tRNA (cmo5U34)-methyltransferase
MNETNEETTDKDDIYRQPLDQVSDFRFDHRVVRVFPDMIRRSVPGYELVLDLLALAARQFTQPASNIYDLGCSLGAATLAMRRSIPHADCRIIAVDNASDMVDRCCEQMRRDNSIIEVDVIAADVLDIDISNASLVVLNFTLQFIAPQRRVALLQTIHDGLRPGGVLLIAEKLCFYDQRSQQLLDQWHQGFKRSQGYSDLEIAQKRQALENVMQPDSLETHQQRLQQVGFDHVCQWFQALNFAAVLARKD